MHRVTRPRHIHHCCCASVASAIFLEERLLHLFLQLLARSLGARVLQTQRQGDARPLLGIHLLGVIHGAAILERHDEVTRLSRLEVQFGGRQADF